MKARICFSIFYMGLLLLNPSTFAQNPIEVSGNITENTTWPADTIKVTGDITVFDNVTLSINPGAYIEFQGHFTINVFGTFIAKGNENDTIIFTVADTTGFENMDTTLGGWHGIHFQDAGMSASEDTSRIICCRFEYGKAINDKQYIVPEYSGGAIYVYNSTKIIIERSVFQLCRAISGAAIEVWDSDLIICNCAVRKNYSINSIVSIMRSDNAKIYKNEFFNNISGSAIYVFQSKAEISKNVIHSNTGGQGAGLSLSSSPQTNVSNNIFSNNDATFGGAIFLYGGNTKFINNIICNNYSQTYGGGILVKSGNPVFVNNTICNNYSLNNGGGIYCENISHPVLINNILWGNTSSANGDQVYFSGTLSSADISFCDIEGGKADLGLEPGLAYTGKYTDNIQEDPQFVNPSAGAGNSFDGLIADWSLLTYSPCTNAGDPDTSSLSIPAYDIYGKKRITKSIIDIGASEVHYGTITMCGSINKDTTLFADTVIVNCNTTVEDNYTLTILPGTILQFTGNYRLEIKGSLYAVGSSTDSIVFTVNDTLGFRDPETVNGGWGGIWFYNSDGSMHDNDTSVLSYCRLEFVKRTIIVPHIPGAIYCYNIPAIHIRNSLFINNIGDEGGGLRISGSGATIENTCFINNIALKYGCGGLHISQSNVIISNCIIKNNTSSGTSGGIIFDNSQVILRNSIIERNSSVNGVGGVYSAYGQIILENNLVSNNNSKLGAGLYIFEPSGSSILVNNIICNNVASGNGGGLYISLKSPLVFSNNTVTNNFSGNRGGGIYINSDINTGVYNTIFWGNSSILEGSQVYINSQKPVDFFNCNIQDGNNGIYGNAGQYSDNLDSDPQFYNPTQGAGAEYDGTLANWEFLPVSPCINAGFYPLKDVIFPEYDFLGNPRINKNKIDIGAIENQADLLKIISQPVNRISCAGDSTSFSISVNDTAFFQWQIDGTDIPGATSPVFTVNPVSSADQGNYSCRAVNGYGSVESNPVYLLVNLKPEILIEPENLWVSRSEKIILRAEVRGSEPMTFQWFKDKFLISGANLPEYKITSVDYSHEGAYTCVINNNCGTDTTNPATLYLAPQLCMVTVSTLTGNNLVIWEKNSKAPLTAFNIYCESTAAGIYDLIGTVPYNSLSVLEDTTADPTKRAYIYKITGTDTSGTETDIDLCNPHKTIHLLVSTNPELKSTQLAWDKYYGFDYQTYNIYRSNTGSNFTVIDAMSSTLNSWTDPEPITGEFYYRVAVEKPIPCVPTGGSKKADSGPYSHSMSNMDDNRLQSGEYPPDTLMLTNHSIDENNFVGKLIGRFLTTDPDTNEAFTYTLVNGDGDDDNLSFTLLADLLIAAHYFDYETKDQYSIRVRSTDKTGNTIEDTFIIYINDISEPTGVNFPSGQQVMVYPNPLRQTSTIIFPNPEGNEYTLLLMNLSGKVVRRIENITTSSLRIERGDLESGYYLIELRGEKVYRGRMVIE